MDERTRSLADANRTLRQAMGDSLEACRVAEAASRAQSEFLARMFARDSHADERRAGHDRAATRIRNSIRRQRRFAATIQSSADALLAIINDILDFSKIEAGKLRLETQDLDIRQGSRGSHRPVRASARTRRASSCCSTSTRILHRWARGDELRIRQILMNLVSNALKFTASGPRADPRARHQPVRNPTYHWSST